MTSIIQRVPTGSISPSTPYRVGLLSDRPCGPFQAPRRPRTADNLSDTAILADVGVQLTQLRGFPAVTKTDAPRHTAAAPLT